MHPITRIFAAALCVGVLIGGGKILLLWIQAAPYEALLPWSIFTGTSVMGLLGFALAWNNGLHRVPPCGPPLFQLKCGRIYGVYRSCVTPQGILVIVREDTRNEFGPPLRLVHIPTTEALPQIFSVGRDGRVTDLT